jgi:hypothetical protein
MLACVMLADAQIFAADDFPLLFSLTSRALAHANVTFSDVASFVILLV